MSEVLRFLWAVLLASVGFALIRASDGADYHPAIQAILFIAGFLALRPMFKWIDAPQKPNITGEK